MWPTSAAWWPKRASSIALPPVRIASTQLRMWARVESSSFALVLDRVGGLGAVERRQPVAQVHELAEARDRGLRPGVRRVAEVLRARLVEQLERAAAVLDRALAAVEGQERARVAVAGGAREAQHEARVLHHRGHLVRHFAVVLPVVDVAVAEDALRLLHAHQLVRGGHEVHEEVGRQAARVVPEEPPLEEAAQVEVARRRPADEALEVHGLGRGVGRDRVVPGAGRGVAVEATLDERHLADPPALDQLARLLRAAHAHVLAADLEHLAALIGGGDERLALLPGVGHRLLDVDVLAGGERVLRSSSGASGRASRSRPRRRRVAPGAPCSRRSWPAAA